MMRADVVLRGARARATVSIVAVLVVATAAVEPTLTPTTIRANRLTADSTWVEHDRAARDARLRGDWRDALYHIVKVDSIFGAHPAVLFALARAHARLGDSTAAASALEELAAMRVTAALSADSAVAALVRWQRVAAIEARLRQNAAGQGTYERFAVLPDSDFIAEGIVRDARWNRLLVSSMRYGRIVALPLSANAQASTFATIEQGWSPLGMSLDASRKRLWVGVSASPLAVHYNAADSGRGRVLRLDLATGALSKVYELPRAEAHEPGDLAVAVNGDVFISDGRAGKMYVIRADVDTLAELVPSGTMTSPQGIVVAADGKRLLVADYTRGIAAVDRASGAVSWLSHPRGTAVNGIDGLIATGDGLLAVQNGVAPDRLIMLELDTAWQRVQGVRVVLQDTAAIREPTHAVPAGPEVYFVANGGADQFTREGAPKPGVRFTPPVIGRVRLRGSPRAERR